VGYKPSSEELGNHHQTPTLIGCIFLKNPSNFCHSSRHPAAISDALHCSTLFRACFENFLNFFEAAVSFCTWRREQRSPPL
ncbi:MAG: hypothetical protein ACKOWC_02150, partial [Limnohabitans sp.]